MSYLLGVDGGASKTHALVINQRGDALGFGTAGCANHQIAGLSSAVAEIRKAVEKAVAAASLPAGQIKHGCFCLAGADLQEDYIMLMEAVAALSLVQTVIIKNDTMAALRAGLSRPWGVVVVYGTGFNAAGRGRDGRELILPGLGYISGDWGGGGEISQEIIRLVMRAWDGRGAQTQLTTLVLKQLEVASEEVLLRHLYHGKITYQKLLQLVPLLFQAAEANDRPSQELIRKMGQEVATTATALLKRLSLQDANVDVVLAGGVFKGQGSLLTDTIKEEVHKTVPCASVVRLRYAPVVGAALLALEAAGTIIDEEPKQNLEATIPEELRQTTRDLSKIEL